MWCDSGPKTESGLNQDALDPNCNVLSKCYQIKPINFNTLSAFLYNLGGWTYCFNESAKVTKVVAFNNQKEEIKSDLKVGKANTDALGYNLLSLNRRSSNTNSLSRISLMCEQIKVHLPSN